MWREQTTTRCVTGTDNIKDWTRLSLPEYIKAAQDRRKFRKQVAVSDIQLSIMRMYQSSPIKNISNHCVQIFAVCNNTAGNAGTLTSKCSSIYGGFVIPNRIIAPSGMTSTSCHNNSGNVTPISCP